MLKNHDRERFIHAILFFAENTRYLGKIKLFKLLYLVDFEHFKQTGLSITGMEYRAWKMGPVPAALVQQWDELDQDLAAAIDIVPERVIDYVRERVVSKVPFRPDLFTKRELKLMREVAQRHENQMSAAMIDVTHAENGAWSKVWNNGAGNDEVIRYELALADDHPRRDEILASATEYQALNIGR